MCRENMMKLSAKLHRGFSLVSAIFLLVVLSALGTMMVTFFVAQQQSSALDVMGSRAYQAARAGVEWAAYNVAQPAAPWAGCATYAASTPLFVAGTATALAGTLSPFTVALTCTASSYNEGSTINVYDITAIATSDGAPGNPDYVERVISVKFGK